MMQSSVKYSISLSVLIGLRLQRQADCLEESAPVDHESH
jgi:hypothetical protein